MHELLRRPRIVRRNDSLLGEVDLDIQFVQRHPALEIGSALYLTFLVGRFAQTALMFLQFFEIVFMREST
jgi:hypothetical protein